jgi:hypothetical protein
LAWLAPFFLKKRRQPKLSLAHDPTINEQSFRAIF